MYNLSVAVAQTFYVGEGQWLVHNCPAPDVPVFRGGNDLTPSAKDVKIDPETGLLKTTHGVSTFNNAGRVERFGGAYEVVDVPEGLKVQQRGNDPTHYEIMPAKPMTMDEYTKLLQQVKVQPVKKAGDK